jgi:hypothetical protein
MYFWLSAAENLGKIRSEIVRKELEISGIQEVSIKQK